METLKQLVDHLTISFLPAAVRNHSFFINDIPDGLPVEHNREWVASVISGMISILVNNGKNSCIRLSAKKYGYVVVLEVQETGSVNSYMMYSALQQVQLLAEKIGGSLQINTQNKDRTVISFSFSNLSVAA